MNYGINGFELNGIPVIIVKDIVVQKRKHKKKRINKKWKKRYGVTIRKRMEDGKTILIDNTLYMNQYTYTMLETNLMYKNMCI